VRKAKFITDGSDSGQLFEFNQKRTGADGLSYQRTLTGLQGTRQSRPRSLPAL